MASLYRNSAEDTDPTIVKGGTVTTVTSPSPINSGFKSWQMDPNPAISYVELTPTTTTGTIYYIRAYFYITGAPGALARLLEPVTVAGGTTSTVRLATNRTLNIYDSLGNFVIDSTTVSAPLALNTWNYVELATQVNTGTGTGQTGFRLNGTLVVPLTSANTGTSLINRIRAGKDTATTIAGLYTDDFAVNDSTGASDNSWVGAIGGGGGGGGGTPTLVTPSWVTPPTPAASATVTGQNVTIEATTNDNVKVSKIEYYKESAINYHQNPSTEIDITGWASNGSPPVAPTRVTDIKQSGAASLKITGDASGDGASYQLPGTSPLPASQSWTASFSYNVVSYTGSNIGTFAIRERTTSGEVGFTIANFDLSKTGWNRVSVTRQFGATGVDVELQIITLQSASTFDIRADDFMITQSSIQPYFSGDSVNAIWLGVAHQSSSSLRELLNTQLFAPYDWPWDTNSVSNGSTNMIARVTQTDGQTVEINRIFNVQNTNEVVNYKIKIAGTFISKPITTKVNGTFVAKPIYLFGYDSPPPPTSPVTAIWQTPNSGATLSGNQIITITTNDDSRVADVVFSVGGTTIQTEPDPPWSFLWNTTTRQDGPVTVTATINHTDATPDVVLTRDFIIDNIVAPTPTVGVYRGGPHVGWWNTNQNMRNGVTRGDNRTQPFVPGSVGWVAAYRMVFDESFTLEDLWISMKGLNCTWWNKSPTGSVYCMATGGILNARLVPVTATGQPRFTDTTNMLGEELNVDPATRHNAIKALFPSVMGFTFPSGSDGPMAWYFKPRKSGSRPVIEKGVVYAFCVWNSHPNPGTNFMCVNPYSVRNYIWPPSTPNIASWPDKLKTGGSGRAMSAQAVDNMDPDCPGTIAGFDPRECLMWSTNGGATFPKVGAGSWDYAGAPDPAYDGCRLPVYAYRKQGDTAITTNHKNIGYSDATTGNAHTYPATPVARQLTHAWAHTRPGESAGTVTITHKRGATTIGTATASFTETTGGMQCKALSGVINLLAGDHYIADPSGTVVYMVGDTNAQSFGNPAGYNRPQVGALPEYYIGGQGDIPINTNVTVQTPTPPDTSYKGYWGALPKGTVYGVGDPPWEYAAWDLFEAHAGKAMSMLHFGQPPPWTQAWASTPFNLLIARGAIPMCSMGIDGRTLAQINSGSTDANWTTWANAAKAWGKPFLLRLMWEMNGTWYAHGSEAAADPAAFRSAWQRIHGLVNAAGATNVCFYFCPNIIFPGSTPLSSLYPGDAYIDWTGFDAYNWGTSTAKGAPGTWETFSDTITPTYNEFMTIAPGKPMAIGEIASTEFGGNKAAWITDMYAKIPTDFPNIKATVWFNWNIPDTNGTWDWQIESSTAAQNAFAAAVAPSHFLPNSYANLPSLSKVPLPSPIVAPPALPPSAYRDEVLADTPYLYWRLGESGGGTAEDATANNRDGSYNNTPTLGVSGAVPGDTAVQFTAASSEYVRSTSAIFNSANATLEAWIYITALPGAAQNIAGCINGVSSSTADKLLSIGADGKLYFYVFDPLTGNPRTTSAPASTIPINQWVHVAGTTGASAVRAYVNGVQVGTNVTTSSFTGYGFANVQVAGADSSASPHGYFNGKVDEFAIYSTELSAARLLAHYNAA